MKLVIITCKKTQPIPSLIVGIQALWFNLSPVQHSVIVVKVSVTFQASYCLQPFMVSFVIVISEPGISQDEQKPGRHVFYGQQLYNENTQRRVERRSVSNLTVFLSCQLGV